MTAAKFLSSSCEPRMSRHCTSGKPASIITENCRVKTARFFAATDLPLGALGAAAFAASLTGLICVTRICSRRNAATAPSIESATRSPVTVCPARVRPLYAKVAIYCLLHCSTVLTTGCPCSRARTAEPRTRDHTDAAIDQVLQLVAVRRRHHCGLERDHSFLIERRQRLVHRLHAHLFLARLHGRIDLMNLVFADQIPDAVRRHHDFERD